MLVRKFITETLQSLAIALVLAFIIRLLIFQPFYVPSKSMVPTLRPGDRFIVSKFNYWFAQPQRGDVIVFKYPVNPDKDFVKRVIGLSGETLSIRNNHVYINGKKLDEPYLRKNLVMEDFGPVPVPEGTLFMMGDNRNDSRDSRFWGPLDKDLIIGKAIVRFWPLNRSGFIK